MKGGPHVMIVWAYESSRVQIRLRCEPTGTAQDSKRPRDRGGATPTRKCERRSWMGSGAVTPDGPERFLPVVGLHGRRRIERETG